GSHAYFDVDNVPPWDSWVLYVTDPLAPEQRQREQARGRRPGRWSDVPPTGEHYLRGAAAPWYIVEPAGTDSYLVSWVPPVLIPLAHTGIIVNPECCIEWLADRDTLFTQALNDLHLLV